MQTLDLSPESIYHLAKALKKHGKRHLTDALDNIESQGYDVQDDIVVVGEIVYKKMDSRTVDPDIIVIHGLVYCSHLNPRS